MPQKTRQTHSDDLAMFEGQGRHLVLLLGLVAWTCMAVHEVDRAGEGSWLGFDADAWIVAAVALPILHQVWVLLWWRLEYYLGATTRVLGRAAFPVYGAGFALLAFVRIFTVVGLALANRDTVPLDGTLAWTAAGVLTLPVLWLFYSLIRYFGFAHALGGDHFFEHHRTGGICRQGIFRFVPNAMYTVGFFILWVPAVAFASSGALILCVFNHAYIWVHYYCTERPDMRRIYASN